MSRRLDGGEQRAEVPALPAPGAEMSEAVEQANALLRERGYAERDLAVHTGPRGKALLKGILHCACCECSMGHHYTAKGGKRRVVWGAEERGHEAFARPRVMYDLAKLGFGLQQYASTFASSLPFSGFDRQRDRWQGNRRWDGKRSVP